MGAFNDNFYKNAMIMLITFKLSESAEETGILITLAAGLFILPFFLFSSLAGQLADKYSKSTLIKKVNLAEVLVMLLGSFSLLNQQLELLFITLFLMGTQSAFFGPLKYAILPEIVDEQNLMKSNGLFSGSTFMAILLGTILGGAGVLMLDGTQMMALAIVVVSLLGYLISLGIKLTPAQNPALPIETHFIKSSWQIVLLCKDYHSAFFAVMAISWFWFLGAVLLSQIPSLVKYDLMANDSVVTLFLSVFSVGIAIGALLINLLLKGRINLMFHGFFLFTISGLLVILVWLIQLHGTLNPVLDSTVQLMSIASFMTAWPVNASVVILLLIAVLGGAYIVPLYTLLQTQTPTALRARMIAVNNILNALFMVLSSILVIIGFTLSVSLLNMLLVLALINLLISGVIYLKQNKLEIKV
ncbi:MAG: acyl-[acyl-carrier-protein]-phospholipid O-acyltransferase/long-chain-fatty-acid--[acyl-carrier-protein] ligase [Thiomicrorhabdus sp.]|nr:MAG: acyl-[acyl-carrier-protein]-phospholipid O-acyltransferase/long-chain-fatty-acid--[acyl-carrier-protein] ligase [Thiomicrorhabdus sp.]